MALFPDIERGVPEKAVGQVEIGTGLFKSDVITVFDANKPDQPELPTPQHVSDINTFVSDILESQFNPGATDKLPKPKTKTTRNALRKLIPVRA